MASDPQLAFNFLTRGMNSAVDPVLLGSDGATNVVARMVNCRLEGQLPRSRYGVREIRVEAEDAGVLENWRGANLQGAMGYNPAYGLSGKSYAEQAPYLLEAAGGRKYALRLYGRARGESFAQLTDVTGAGGSTPADLMLAWMCQAEPYAIVCDGFSDTWIWNGDGEAVISAGYDTVDKTRSRLANGASLPMYVNYRVHQVVNGRQVIVGDALHRQNLSDPRNLLETTEQAHFATGLYFSPPSNMGAILGAIQVPVRDSRYGVNEVTYFCERGMWSLDSSPPDRASWANQPLVKNRQYHGGPCGPYAADVYDHAVVYLSNRGIEMLGAAAGSSAEWIGPEVRCFLDGDHEPDRRFASLVNFEDSRLYCTVDPVVRGPYRSSRGAVVLNWNSAESASRKDPRARAWEGLMTLPSELGEFVQFVAMDVDGEKRLFAHTWEPNPNLDKVGGLFDGFRHLVEITDWLDGYDEVLYFGTSEKVRFTSALITRVMTGREYFKVKDFTGGLLYLRDVIGQVDLEVYFRADGQGEWRLWDAGKLEDDSRRPTPRNLTVQLGTPGGCETINARAIQVMVRWRGRMTLESVGTFNGQPQTLSHEPNLKSLLRTPAKPRMRYSDYAEIGTTN